MEQIDWSKAPEGAEWARKTTAGVDWYRRNSGMWVYWTSNGWAQADERPAFKQLINGPANDGCRLQMIQRCLIVIAFEMFRQHQTSAKG